MSSLLSNTSGGVVIMDNSIDNMDVKIDADDSKALNSNSNSANKPRVQASSTKSPSNKKKGK